MAIKLTKDDTKRASKCLDDALKGTGKLRARLREKKNAGFRERLAARKYREFVAANPNKVGDWQEFFKWLLENLPAIIAAIMALFK